MAGKRSAAKAAEHAPARRESQRIDARARGPYRHAACLGKRNVTAIVTAEAPEHAEAIERVLDRAFGPGRRAKTSERVRERCAAPEPTLSRVAVNEGGEVVGVCRIWRSFAGAPIFFLGPLAVDPAAQNAGLGLTLAGAAVAACRSARGAALLAVGAQTFFAPLGFAVAPEGRLSLPGPVDPARLLWLELTPGGADQVGGELKAPPP